MSLSRWLVLACSVQACGSSARERTHGEPNPADASEPGAPPVCEERQRARCSCDAGLSGWKTCTGNRFGGCACDTASTEADIDSDAEDAPPKADLCKAGYYVGNFVGSYLPDTSSGSLVPTELGVMVSGQALNDIPALSFTLEHHDIGPAGEFSSFSVGDGCMSGSAQLLGFIDNPFIARIRGELDCETGYFDGWLDGQYTLFNLSPIPTAFSGPFTAQFALPQTLRDGKWEVTEPAGLTGSQAGGKGTWSAEWAADRGRDAAVDPCAAIAPSAGGSRDAGAKLDASTRGDAGAP